MHSSRRRQSATMGVSTPYKPHRSHHSHGHNGGKKVSSSKHTALDYQINTTLMSERSHALKKAFRADLFSSMHCPPSGAKPYGVVERACFLTSGSTVAYDQISGGVYCAATGKDGKLTGEEWAVNFRGEESLLPKQFRLTGKRSRAIRDDDSSSSSSDEDDHQSASEGEAEQQALVKATPATTARGGARKSSTTTKTSAKKNRSAPAAPKKKARRAGTQRDQAADEDADLGDTTETEASHLARTRQNKEGDQVLVPSTSGDAAEPERQQRSDGEQSLGRGKRITNGRYGRSQKSKRSTSASRSGGKDNNGAKTPRPKQRDTALADPLNAYNHDFETPAFETSPKGSRSRHAAAAKRAASVTGDSEVARLCARVDDLGVRSTTGSSASSVMDADTVRGSPAPEVDDDDHAVPIASTSTSSASPASSTMTRSASKGKGRAL
ncbi:hypothetical protein JCM10908_002421 [Rhodotorula pacifica]|uniref:uncharacterized protein n=1 Tax=Rhodotorula pacifica TaxID=1495444 RepID=UPI0031765A69